MLLNGFQAERTRGGRTHNMGYWVTPGRPRLTQQLSPRPF